MRPDEAAVQQVPAARETVEAVGRLAKSAFSDGLTGLLNQAAFDAVAAEYDRLPLARLAVVFIDLTGFKAINDGHGHGAGNAALIRVASALSEFTGGDKGTAFRVGGDEFLILTQADRGAACAKEACRRLLSLTVDYQGHRLEVRGHVGFSIPSEGGVTLATLVGQAEAACRIAKWRGDLDALLWSAEIEQDRPTDLRMRCEACGSTTSLLVLPSRRQATALDRCANCSTEYKGAK